VLGFLLLLGLQLFQLDTPADCAKSPGGGNQGGKQAEQYDDTRSQRPQARILGIQGLEVHGQLLEIEQRLFGCGRLSRGIFCSLLFGQFLGSSLALEQGRNFGRKGGQLHHFFPVAVVCREITVVMLNALRRRLLPTSALVSTRVDAPARAIHQDCSSAW
jgi:hypothetical protein